MSFSEFAQRLYLISPLSLRMVQTVLITGGSDGIGLALAKLFSRDHFRLILVARSKEKLQAAQEHCIQLGADSVRTIALDLSTVGSAEKLYALTKKEQVDILVNNAGFGMYGNFSETNLLKEQEMMHVLMITPTVLTKLFLRDMQKRGSGKILQVASTAAFQPGPTMAVYFASKAYLLSFSEALAYELRGSGVSVTTLCPGATATNFQHVTYMGHTKLFTSTMDVKSVAREGYSGLMKNKTLVVCGFKNKFLIFLIRFFPRKLVTAVTRRVIG